MGLLTKGSKDSKGEEPPGAGAWRWARSFGRLTVTENIVSKGYQRLPRLPRPVDGEDPSSNVQAPGKFQVPNRARVESKTTHPLKR
jgi:hypothetical protein